MAYSGWVASSDKPGSTTTDGATDKISDARADLQKAIVALNKIVDIFQLEAEPTDNHILKYDQSAGKFATEADSGAASTTIGVQDMWIAVDTMYSSTTNGAAGPSSREINTTSPDLRNFAFDKDTQESIEFNIAMPKKWNEGTITCEFYWTAASGSGGVTWAIQGTSRNNDEALNSGWATAVEVDDTLITANDLHISATSSGAFIASTPAAGELQYFKVYRVVADSNDTLDADAELLGIKFHYTSDAENDA